LYECYESLVNVNYYNSSEEFYRIVLLQSFNDRIRKNSSIFLNYKDKLIYRINIYALIALINQRTNISFVDSNDNTSAYDIMILAELYRNCNIFDACMSCLKMVDDPNFNLCKEIMIKKCHEENNDIFEIN